MINADFESNKSRDLRKIVQSIFGKESSDSDLSGYSVGDVKSHLTIRVQQHTNLVGDVLAPRVIIAGIVHGSVICRELIVTSTGQLWGDVSAVTSQIQPGGKVHGWQTTFDEGTIDLLIAGEISPTEISVNTPLLPEGIGGDLDLSEELSTDSAKLIWSILRREASAALQARSEIELTFNKRVQEAISTTLEESLQSERSETTSRLDDTDEDSWAPTLETNPSRFEITQDEKTFEIEQLRSLVGRIASVAHQYQLQYLWAKASLNSELRVSQQQQDYVQQDDGRH